MIIENQALSVHVKISNLKKYFVLSWLTPKYRIIFERLHSLYIETYYKKLRFLCLYKNK